MDRSLRRRPGRSRTRSLLTCAFVLAVVAGLLGACTSDDPGAQPVDTTPAPSTTSSTTSTIPEASTERPVAGGQLRVASGPLPTDWSPTAQVWDTSAAQVARGLYDRLMAYDAEGVAQPELAESVEPDATFTRWTITVRPGTTFHDGSTLDATAVQANLEAQRTSPVGTDLLAPVAGVTVTGPRTVVVTMSSPWSTFPEVLAGQLGTIAAPATLAAGGAVPPNGTGPFRWPAAPADLAAVDPPPEPGEVVLVRNDGYWKPELPYLDAVRFPVYLESSGRSAAVARGDADLVVADRPNQLLRLDRAAEREQVRLVEDRNAEVPKVVVALNTGAAPFDQISARRAVGLATDRAEVVELSLLEQGVVARGLISDPSPWFTDLPEPVPDTNRASEQLDSYVDEFGGPLAFTVLITPDPLVADVAALWRAQLREVGIAVTVEQVEPTELEARLRRGEYQAAMGIGFSSPHPDLYEPLFRGLPGEQPAVNPNVTRYVDLDVTEAFAEARATSDVAVQVEQYRLVQEAVWEDLPWLPLVQLRQVVAVAPEVRDVQGWALADGEAGLGVDRATVSLAQVWLAAPAPTAAAGTTTTTSGAAEDPSASGPAEP